MKAMKGQVIFEKMTQISDCFIEEAAEMPMFGTAYPVQRVERHPYLKDIGRFWSSAPGVALLCAMVSISVVVAMVMWGRNGMNSPPAGQPVESQTETETVVEDTSPKLPEVMFAWEGEFSVERRLEAIQKYRQTYKTVLVDPDSVISFTTEHSVASASVKCISYIEIFNFNDSNEYELEYVPKWWYDGDYPPIIEGNTVTIPIDWWYGKEEQQKHPVWSYLISVIDNDGNEYYYYTRVQYRDFNIEDWANTDLHFVHVSSGAQAIIPKIFFAGFYDEIFAEIDWYMSWKDFLSDPGKYICEDLTYAGDLTVHVHNPADWIGIGRISVYDESMNLLIRAPAGDLSAPLAQGTYYVVYEELTIVSSWSPPRYAFRLIVSEDIENLTVTVIEYEDETETETETTTETETETEPETEPEDFFPVSSASYFSYSHDISPYDGSLLRPGTAFTFHTNSDKE